jgi:acyl-CoA thioesterase FadM
MARIKIEMPPVKLAELTIPVRISDVNYGKHVGNDAFVSILHEARLQWLNQKGYSELEVGGAGLIMADLALEFKNESFYGDIITVNLYAGEMSRVSFELFYQLTTQRNNNMILLANAKTGMICYNYQTSKPVSLTGAIKTVLAGN